MSAAAIQRLQEKRTQTDALVDKLRKELDIIKQNAVSAACLAEEERLRKENEILRKDINELKKALTEVEIKHGVKQVGIPTEKGKMVPTPVKTESTQAKQADSKTSEDKAQQKKEKKVNPKGENKEKKQKANQPTAVPVSPSMLNMRIGKIISVKKHQDADTLYVEEVDVGEERNRTVVSGLVKHVTLEEMQDRIAIFTVNLKPAKMRGILSEGMIMCGSSPEHSEIIVPPAGATIGSRVTIDGYPGDPEPQLNPKKKIFEQIQPDFLINAEGIATYKGKDWVVENCPGKCTVPTMRNSGIK